RTPLNCKSSLMKSTVCSNKKPLVCNTANWFAQIRNSPHSAANALDVPRPPAVAYTHRFQEVAMTRNRVSWFALTALVFLASAAALPAQESAAHVPVSAPVATAVAPPDLVQGIENM